MKIDFRFRHIALMVPLALLSATACGDQAPADEGSGGSGSDTDEGTGGRDGDSSGGESNDGTGGGSDEGTGGEGGDANDGSGGSDEGTGGSVDGSGGASGGSGGTSGGSGGGSGGVVGDCGDGDVEALEQCDDDNAINGDTCSNECTLTACDTCRDAACGDFGQYLTCDGYVNPENPSDTTGRAHCEALLECYRDECGRTGDPRVCYCGTGGQERGTQAWEDFMGTCFAPFAATDLQAGVCRAEIEAASGTASPIGIGTLWFNPDTALGFANQTVQCEQDECAGECDHFVPEGTGGSGSGGESGVGGSGSGGTAGSGGDTGSGGAGGGPTGCHEGDAACEECVACRETECADEWTEAFVGVSRACPNTTFCYNYLACVDSTGCAVSGGADDEADLQACYCGDRDLESCLTSIDQNYPNGPCVADVTTLAGDLDPADVDRAYFDGTSMLSQVNDILLCQKVMCESECADYFEAP